MLQFLLTNLTKHLEPPAEITLNPTNCSVRGRIRTIETRGQEMRVCIDPWDSAFEVLYQFTTINPLHQAHVLSAKLGDRFVAVESHAPTIPTSGFPRNGGTIQTITLLDEDQ